jgi:hypothetical protein
MLWGNSWLFFLLFFISSLAVLFWAKQKIDLIANAQRIRNLLSMTQTLSALRK